MPNKFWYLGLPSVREGCFHAAPGLGTGTGHGKSKFARPWGYKCYGARISQSRECFILHPRGRFVSLCAHNLRIPQNRKKMATTWVKMLNSCTLLRMPSWGEMVPLLRYSAGFWRKVTSPSLHLLFLRRLQDSDGRYGVDEETDSCKTSWNHIIPFVRPSRSGIRVIAPNTDFTAPPWHGNTRIVKIRPNIQWICIRNSYNVVWQLLLLKE